MSESLERATEASNLLMSHYTKMQFAVEPSFNVGDRTVPCEQFEHCWGDDHRRECKALPGLSIGRVSSDVIV